MSDPIQQIRYKAVWGVGHSWLPDTYKSEFFDEYILAVDHVRAHDTYGCGKILVQTLLDPNEPELVWKTTKTILL